MAFLGKLQRVPPPTSTDLVKDQATSPPLHLLGKSHVRGNDVDSTLESRGHHVLAHTERNVVRKMDLRIVPLVTALYVLSFLDRSNIGNARIAGMTHDLHLIGNDYQWLLTIFYITYIIFEFQALMWKIVPPHIWLAFTAITSGHPHLAKWRLLFLVEGLPTICMAPVAYFFLPDTPDKARFFSEDEKVGEVSLRMNIEIDALKLIAKARGVRQVGGVERVGGIVWKEIGLALLDLKCWFTAFMYFSCNVGFSSLPVFLPTILNDMGFNAIDSQGLTAPPFFVSFLVTILSTWVADKTQQRGYTIMVLTTVGGIGYILLATVESVGIANILPWVTNNQGSDTRRGTGIVLLNLIGQCGPLLGTNSFPTNESPRYIKGMAISAAFTFFTGFLALGLRCLLVWENRKLDKVHGFDKTRVVNQRGEEEQESEVGEENYGPKFRFIL
ncbi:MAG: hypothetical protein ASARMPREDX12_001511 [Alectoria sarmentosa]|nr:MAG: hypothetical protein ASARMPREDX12_001511 [Alectoria sarmentosa]